ncbi:Arc family DNA-binding protein [Flavonifractor plautii]|jgi:hypothetical protein|uniref:Arc family DNA-binding protein n=2 Tax=Clostridia TaxID=186801 RepID=UPI0028FF2554|nr:Arc family DNA-binding protein [Flavonifractor plautii]
MLAVLPNKVGKVMPNVSHKNPHFALRIEEAKMDKLKYIAGHNGRSANKEIEQLILAHIASYESVHDPIVLTEEDYDFIRKRTNR